MRVDTRFVTLNTNPSGAARRSEPGQAFALSSPAPNAPGATATPAASLAGLDAILTLQSNTDTPEERRRRSARRGNDLLDGLDRLKAALLMGRVSPRDLQAIAARLNERAGTSGDPRLDGLIADIELRAAVELAKLSASAARAA
ncbi:flagellar assembly protein FliX [Methylobacterium sp. J-068]|uniref:flagellar assembly protein FliX n=1 Tax=Methylobacterium sp. J-068 TaxID=2836649 RepID=UPI001FBB6094|nr:flagellar assembly protein FliX [Methylobacterium sp. J-068]MCJ2034325.1 flagellar assembly protein FliX [Methylobacterium sp. J-068]